MYPPNAKLTLVQGPAAEPLSVADANGYLRLENDADDALVGDLIVAARLMCEQTCDRSFLQTTWKLTLDYLPFGTGLVLGLPFLAGMQAAGGFGRLATGDGGIALPRPSLIAVASLAYLDGGGTSRTLDPSQYIVSPGTPGRVYPAYGQFFPFSQPRPAAVDITYTAGYGTDPASVPRNVVAAIRLLVAHLYAHRSEQAEIPDAVANLLGPSRWGGYA